MRCNNSSIANQMPVNGNGLALAIPELNYGDIFFLFSSNAHTHKTSHENLNEIIAPRMVNLKIYFAIKTEIMQITGDEEKKRISEFGFISTCFNFVMMWNVKNWKFNLCCLFCGSDFLIDFNKRDL